MPEMPEMPEMSRRRMMLMTGITALVAATPLPEARAYPSLPTAPANGQSGPYIFQDEFDGPAGSAPDSSKWTVARARAPMQDPAFWGRPENVGQYRADRRHLFVHGK